MNGDITLEV